MTGPEHYREAERALEAASNQPDYGHPAETYLLRRAQVHATLALAFFAAGKVAIDGE